MLSIKLAVATSVFFTNEASVVMQAGFDKFLADFNRPYAQGSTEYSQRFTLFQERLAAIDAHNSNPNRLWTAGISHLTDRTDAELSMLFGWKGGGPRQHTSLLASEAGTVKIHRVLAESVDWTNLSMASKVPDQGGCGSCWAVATAEMLKANYETQRQASRSFSAQQLVNCVPNPKECGGQGGCKGATVELAMKYAQEMGLESEAETRYLGRDGHCKHTVSQASSFLAKGLNIAAASLQLKQWNTLAENKAEPLMLALSDGPVAISVGAGDWHLYSNGIFDSCSKDAVINHAVVLFGYGHDGGKKYWKIRNSWGSQWGEKGYIRLLRQNTIEEEDAFCGTDNKPEDGVACKPYPESQRVCGMCGLLFDSVAVKFKTDDL